MIGIGWRHPHYQELLETRPALGFLEVHSENFFGEGGAALAVLEQGRSVYPVSLHGVGLSLGSAIGLDAEHLEQLARLVERIDPVRVSDHASFARGRVEGRVVHAADLLPVPFTEEALRAMVANVDRVQQRLRRPIAVENLSAALRWRHDDRAEIDFLRELAARSGCHLLVDLNNLIVNLRNAGHGVAERAHRAKAWIDALAGTPVAELHLAGHSEREGLIVDDHARPVSEEVWSLHAHALRRLGPVPTLVEWDTDLPPLPALLAEARRAGTQVAAARAPAPLSLGEPA